MAQRSSAAPSARLGRALGQNVPLLRHRSGQARALAGHFCTKPALIGGELQLTKRCGRSGSLVRNATPSTRARRDTENPARSETRAQQRSPYCAPLADLIEV
jgi:hypothetical protein